jgi:hypothetical protein
MGMDIRLYCSFVSLSSICLRKIRCFCHNYLFGLIIIVCVSAQCAHVLQQHLISQLCPQEVAIPQPLYISFSPKIRIIMSKRTSPPPTNKGGQKKPRENDSEHDNSLLNTVPIFLKKLAKMIDTCDTSICAWSEDGEMFVVKNPDRFSEVVIPQYFDHNSELAALHFFSCFCLLAQTKCLITSLILFRVLLLRSTVEFLWLQEDPDEASPK